MFESSSIHPSILDSIFSKVLLNLFNSLVEFVKVVSISILYEFIHSRRIVCKNGTNRTAILLGFLNNNEQLRFRFQR
jgi:hypothetical protein